MKTYKGKYDNVENILEIEGVNAMGYGILAQAAMFDRDISITSKVIYSYLVSYTGSGGTIFPKRETILAHLKMSKNTFYKYLKPLIENGYIKISKAKGFLNKNIYTICNHPEKIKSPIREDDSESQLAIDGINAFGFGFIPKLIMCDPRLSIKAKGLIAFLYSLVQAGNRAFPHRSTICIFLGLSKDSYYKALNQLIENNYITVHQRHTKSGRFTVNDYILNSNPSKTPCPDFCDNEETPINTNILPCPENCDNGDTPINADFSPCPENEENVNSNRVRNFETLPCLDFCDNNNITSINSSNNISTSNLEVCNIPYTQNEDEITEMIYMLTDFEDYSDKTDSFSRKYCKTVKALIEMLSVKEHSLYSKQIVKTTSLFNALNDCITEDNYGLSLRDLICEAVWHYDLCSQRYSIRRPTQYLKALLWDEIKNYNL